MNSNSNLPAYLELGITFGVRDATGQPYPHIKESFLISKMLTVEDILNGSILSPNKYSIPYILNIDKKLREAIFKSNTNSAAAIISFQKHQKKAGEDYTYLAVARLFEKDRTRRTE